jgi:hypothetical protein
MTVALLCTIAPVRALQYTVFVNGELVPLPVPAVSQGGRVFVPMRSIFEALHASVVFNNGTVNATAGTNRVQVRIGSTQAIVNGQTQTLDAAPFMQGSSTMVPLRFVSEALGATVDFNSTNGAIRIATANATAAPTASRTVPGGTSVTTNLTTSVNTATAQVNQPISLLVKAPVPRVASVFEGATFYGHIAAVQRASQGRNPTLELDVDTVRLAGTETRLPVGATISKIAPAQGPNVGMGAAGAGAGMLLGNWIGKMVGTDVGGAAGAAAGYLLASNNRQDITVGPGWDISIMLIREFEPPAR